MQKVREGMLKVFLPMHASSLGRMNKPEVDFINGIPPAIAIEQKVNFTESTVYCWHIN